MMSTIVAIGDFLWGWPLICVIFLGAIVLSVRIRFIQFTKLPFMLRYTFSKIWRKGEGEGNIAPFQAAAASMAATIGVGNIAGVGMALGLGGPGALFWMWVIAMFSMLAKFCEVVLGVKYRELDEATGVFRGGPMYYMRKGLMEPWCKLAPVYSFMFAVTYFVYSFVQSNSLALATKDMFGIDPFYSGVGVAILAGLVIIGGIKVLGRVADKLVPFMAIVYLLGVATILAFNFSNIPGALLSVFQSAFNGHAAIGGFTGATVIAGVRNGFARGIFSNDGGLGLGAVLHATAQTKHPVQQAMWGVFEVFVDTIVVCTGSGLAILVSGVLGSGEKGLALTRLAFSQGIPVSSIGSWLVNISVLLFAFTTIIANAFYCETGFNYLFRSCGKGLRILISYSVKLLCIAGIIYGAMGGLHEVWGIADFFMALLIIINLPVVIYLSGEIRASVKEYFRM